MTRLKSFALGLMLASAVSVGAQVQIIPAPFNGSWAVNNIVVTSTDGFLLQNTTPATVSVVAQYGPRFRNCGTAWKVNATAASEIDCLMAEIRPASAGAATTFTYVWAGSLNAGSYTDLLTLSSAGALTATGGMTATGFTGTGAGLSVATTATGYFGWATRTFMNSTADGLLTITNNATTIGSTIKVDAVPTVSSGFGASPSVTAGSTPLAGEVNVGTGGIATTGVLLYNGTAFPSAPFCVCQDSTSIAAGVCKAKSTTTTLTLTTTVAWTASDLVTYVCVGSK